MSAVRIPPAFSTRRIAAPLAPERVSRTRALPTDTLALRLPLPALTACSGGIGFSGKSSILISVLLLFMVEPLNDNDYLNLTRLGA